jgi:hypothetical protein
MKYEVLEYDHDFGFNFMQLFKKYGPKSHGTVFIKTPNTIQFWHWGLKPMMIYHRDFGFIHNDYEMNPKSIINYEELRNLHDLQLEDFYEI